MKLTHLKIENFRSIEMLELGFPSYYTAICGKNNSGKTNIVRGIRSVFVEDFPYFDEREAVVFARNYPVWKAKEDGAKISIRLDFLVNQNADAELHKFVVTFLSLTNPKYDLPLSVTTIITDKKEKSDEDETGSDNERLLVTRQCPK